MFAFKDFLSAKARKAQFEARRLAGGTRAMPHFMVIGAQKSGTSSMFAYLRQHPRVIRPVYKEPYFFDRHYERGLKWYGSNFPARRTVERLNDRHGHRHLTFEATATYVFDPAVPPRIARDIETRKFILLLRNPVERAISAYWHAQRMGRETRSLGQALEQDMRHYEKQLRWEKGAGPKPEGEAPRPAYLQRGIYHKAVSRWQSVFSPEDILVLQSETMFADPAASMARVFAFLDLPQPEAIDFAPQNVGGYTPSEGDARQVLKAFYRPHNEQLNRICSTPFDW